ncbi:MAG: cation:proton antiporter [Hyphomonadaceae bacterium]|nr:cation:proton antiporter [Hyphomonadaceae bacterium]
MAASLDLSSFQEPLVILAAAGVVIPLFRRLKLSPVVGFILVGLLVGPYVLGALADDVPWLRHVVITEPESIATIAELGIVLLMFMIGLELSFERLNMMRRLVFGLGGLQVGLSALAIGAAAYAVQPNLISSIVLGLGLSMSTTAVILQTLSDTKRLTKSVGRTTFAVLLFQDLAVVPVLFAVSVLGAKGDGSVVGAFGLAMVQAAVAVVVIVILGRIVLRPMFRMVAGAGASESFMAASLLVILGAGIATATAGLSMAMGALIAGILLAETEYRRQIEVTIEPFKGLLLGVFLISVGMSIDLPRIFAAPVLFVSVAFAVVAAKALIVTGLGRLFGLPLGVSMQSGLLLGPGSEFTFVIIGLALQLDLISSDLAALALGVAATTMTLVPLLERIGVWTERRLPAKPAMDPSIAVLPDVSAPPAGRVIICGFGRVGQTVAAMLETHDTPYLAVDQDAKEVSKHRGRGKPIAYGDATRIEFLRLCDIAHARAVVVTLDSPAAAAEIVTAARAERPDILIVCRARDARDAARLYKLGATDAVPETTEASLVLCEQLLVDLGVPMGYVIASVHDRRAAQRAEIQAMAPDATVRRVRLTRARAPRDPG